MNILFTYFFKPEENIGGVEIAFGNLTKSLDKPFETDFVSLRDAILALGLENKIPLNYYPYSVVERSLIMVKYLKQYEEMFDVDLIITSADCSLFYDELKTPFVAVFNNPYKDIIENLSKHGILKNISTYYEFGEFYPRIQKNAGKNSIGNVAVSDYMLLYCKSLGVSCNAVIPFGVDTSIFKPSGKTRIRNKLGIPERATVGIYVGSFHPNSGWDIIQRIVNIRQDIFWIIVLKHPVNYRPKLKNVALFTSVRQSVLANLYNASDFAVFPSYIESLNMKALEACATNLPVITSNSGYFYEKNPKEKISEQEYGIKVNTNNCKYYLKAIDMILSGKYSFSPRKFILDNGITIYKTIEKWEKYLAYLSSKKK